MTAHGTPLRLDPSLCDGCGLCSRACRKKALRVGPGYLLVEWASCDGCGRCADECESGAIELRTPKASATAVAAVPETFQEHFARAQERVVADAPGEVLARWSLPEAALVLVVALALLMGIQTLPVILGRPLPAGATLLVYDAVLAVCVLGLCAWRRTPLLAALRLDRAPELKWTLLALLGAVACWAFSLAYRMGALALGFAPPAGSGTDLAVLYGAGAVGTVATVLVVAVVGPLVEEAALRGLVLGAVRERFGVLAAVLVSAVAFAVLHGSLWSLVPFLVLGLVLGWLAVRSRSLWPAVIAHVVYNAVLVVSAIWAIHVVAR